MKSIKCLLLISAMLLVSCHENPIQNEANITHSVKDKTSSLNKVQSSDCPSAIAFVDLTSLTPSTMTVYVPAGQNYNLQYNIQGNARVDLSLGEGALTYLFIDGINQNIPSGWSICSGPATSLCYNYSGSKSLGAGTHTVESRAFISTICNPQGSNANGYNYALRRDNIINTITVSNQIPSAPTISGSISNGHPKISWSSVQLAQGYKIFRAFDLSSGTYYQIATTTSTNYVDTSQDIYAGTGTKRYVFYKIKAYNGAGDSSFSNIIQFTVRNQIEP